MINNKKYNENLKTECINNDRYNPSPNPNLNNYKFKH